MSSTDPIAGTQSVEVVYATLERQWQAVVPWREGLTALTAVEASGLLAELPDVDLAGLVLGRFGARVAHDAPLRPGDRVEICRPLRADPRAARRALAARGYVIGAGGRLQWRDREGRDD
jgi:uncharacterized protein